MCSTGFSPEDRLPSAKEMFKFKKILLFSQGTQELKEYPGNQFQFWNLLYRSMVNYFYI